VRVERDQVEQGEGARIQRTERPLLRLERGELLGRGQLAVPEQVGDGLERLVAASSCTG
jgi:hypothetical protein